MNICLYEVAVIVPNMQNINSTYRSRTYAIPPDIPAPKFLPGCPRIIARPPVMYSQP